MLSSKEVDAALRTSEWLEERFGYVSEPELNSLLKKITARLETAVYREALGESEKNLLRYNWEVLVIKSPDINAYSLGAGIIVLTSGLVAHLDSEAALAAVISHEMAHHLLAHPRQAIARAAVSSADSRASDSKNNGPTTSFSLDNELAADALGIKILSVSRYDIREAATAASLEINRPILQNVSGLPKSWRQKRLAALHNQISACQTPYPSRLSSREFTRAKRLAGL